MKIKIKIHNDVMERMFRYAYYANEIHRSEIAGWGHYKSGQGIYKLAPLTKQIVTGGDVDNFPNEILHDKKYDISDMIVQWHSHVNMSTFFSSTDKENRRDCVKLTRTLISIVVNCKGEYTAALDTYVLGATTLIEPIDFDVELVPYFNDRDIENEVKKKLTRKVFPQAQQQKNGKNGKKNPIIYPKDGGAEPKTMNPYEWETTHPVAGRIMGKVRAMIRDFPGAFALSIHAYGFYIRHFATTEYTFINPTEFVDENSYVAIWNNFLVRIGGIDGGKFASYKVEQIATPITQTTSTSK